LEIIQGLGKKSKISAVLKLQEKLLIKIRSSVVLGRILNDTVINGVLLILGLLMFVLKLTTESLFMITSWIDNWMILFKKQKVRDVNMNS
jgi:hypothetical protein